MRGTAKVLFKTPQVEQAMSLLDWRFHKVFIPLLQLQAKALGYDQITITDINTPRVHMEGSPHYEGRAIDVRIVPFTLIELEEFADWINDTFDYGFAGYKVALVGRTDPKGKHQDHLHLQVPRPLVAQKGKLPLRW